MRPTLRITFLAVLAAAVLSVGVLTLRDGAARAAGTSCSAHMAGLRTSKKTPVEVVVFNSTGTDVTLDLRLRNADGDVVLERLGELLVGPFKTEVVSLEAELSRDLARKEKPFEGLVAVELTGGAPFEEDAVLVHATQYFGKTKRPRGAVLFRPLFRTND